MKVLADYEYYRTELGVLYCGDCLSILPLIPDNSVDLVLCDLPYGTTACSWDVVIPFDKLWKEYKRLSNTFVLTASQPFTTDLINSNREMFKYEYIWEKSKPSNFQLAKYNPLKYHENVIVFYKTPPIFNQPNLKICFIRSGRKNKGANLGQLKYSDKNFITKNTGFNSSIFKIHNPSGKGHLHPTQKPIILIEKLINIYTNSNMLVLDNCIGSGTTGVACEKLNRRWIGIEISEKYCEIAKKRISQEANQMKLFK